MHPHRIFKIRIVNLAENEFQTTKFSDFPLTFRILLKLLCHFERSHSNFLTFQVSQVSGNPTFGLMDGLTQREDN